MTSDAKDSSPLDQLLSRGSPEHQRQRSAEATPGRELRTHFHELLDQVDDTWVLAGLRVAEELPVLSEGFLQGDRSVLDRSDAMLATVARQCREVEEQGFVLLARESPVAVDLRRLVALLRMTVDVSRSASLLRHACHTLAHHDPRFFEPQIRSQLDELATHATSVFVGGMDAWRRRDALAITEVDRADESVDELQRVLLREVSSTPEPGAELVVLGLLARYYERIADHGVEIARDATFVATGERVRVGSVSDDAA